MVNVLDRAKDARDRKKKRKKEEGLLQKVAETFPKAFFQGEAPPPQTPQTPPPTIPQQDRGVVSNRGDVEAGNQFIRDREKRASQISRGQVPTRTELQQASRDVSGGDANVVDPAQQKALELFRQFQGQPLPQEVLNSLSPSEIDVYQALATGSFSAITGGVGGAITGAIAGAGAGSPITAPIGAGIGIVTGAVQGIRSNIGSQIAGEIRGRSIEFQRIDQDLKRAVTFVRRGGDPIDAVSFFREGIIQLHEAHQQLKLDTDTNLAKFTGKDGTPELARFEHYIENSLPQLEAELLQAIQTPQGEQNLLERDLSLINPDA